MMSGRRFSGLHARTLGAGIVRRVRIIVHAISGLKAEEIATRMDLCGNTVRSWLNRFTARGLKGLEEDVRTGRPPLSRSQPASMRPRHYCPGKPPFCNP